MKSLVSFINESYETNEALKKVINPAFAQFEDELKKELKNGRAETVQAVTIADEGKGPQVFNAYFDVSYPKVKKELKFDNVIAETDLYALGYDRHNYLTLIVKKDTNDSNRIGNIERVVMNNIAAFEPHIRD